MCRILSRVNSRMHRVFECIGDFIGHPRSRYHQRNRPGFPVLFHKMNICCSAKHRFFLKMFHHSLVHARDDHIVVPQALKSRLSSQGNAVLMARISETLILPRSFLFIPVFAVTPCDRPGRRPYKTGIPGNESECQWYNHKMKTRQSLHRSPSGRRSLCIHAHFLSHLPSFLADQREYDLLYSTLNASTPVYVHATLDVPSPACSTI